MKQIILSLSLLLISCSCFAKVYYISPSGNNANDGSMSSSWASLSGKSSLLLPGDTVFLMSGSYSETLAIDELMGSENNPIVITSAPGASVVFDGTYALPNNWEKVVSGSEAAQNIQQAQWADFKGDLYAQKLPEDIYCLVYNDSLMDMATWPNTSWYAPYRLDRSKTLRRASVQSDRGIFYDAEPSIEAEEESATWLTYNRQLYPGLNDEKLSDVKVNHTGASVLMNHSWMSYGTEITSHNVGDDFFSWDTLFTGSGNLIDETSTLLLDDVSWGNENAMGTSKHAGVHYFITGLSALDNVHEWWYHQDSKTIYFVVPTGSVPQDGLAKGKTVDYMLTVTNSEYVTVSGIDFYGAAFKVEECKHTTIKDCNHQFSSFNKFVLSDYSTPETATIINNAGKDDSYGNVVRNCQFKYLDGNSFEGRSNGLVADNILIYQTQQTCLGTDSRSISFDYCSLIRRISISDVGASVGIKGLGTCLYELNRITRFGGLQYDGAALQSVCKTPGTMYQYNWSYNHPKGSFRFDAGNYPNFTNQYCGMAYNIAWNTSMGYRLKGDHLLFHNNVLLKGIGDEMEGIDTEVVLFNMEKWASTNEETFVVNNAVLAFYSGSKTAPILATLTNNITEGLDTLFNDLESFDFRPAQNSALVNKGYDLNISDIPWAVDEVAGSEIRVGKTDIGAYEYGGNKYWIPGYQYPETSSPIPLDGATERDSNQDLIFLNGYQAPTSNFYFGKQKSAVKNADSSSEYFISQFKDEFNIIKLYQLGISLTESTTYYWRVDAVHEDGTITKGDVWEFTTKDKFTYVGDPNSIVAPNQSSCDVRAYPNPVSSTLHVEWTATDMGQPTIVLYNSLGIRQTISYSLEAHGAIVDMSSLPVGLYSLKVGSQVLKIQKQP